MTDPHQTTEHTSLHLFGCDILEFVASVDADPAIAVAGPGMAVMSILSNAQELIEDGQPDKADQLINRAKYLISYYKLGLNT